MTRGAWAEDQGVLDRLDWLIKAVEGPDAPIVAQAVERALARGRGQAGRPREYPALVGVLHMIAAGGITGSHRSSARMLASPRVWAHVREAAMRAHAVELPETPPTRNHLEDWRKRLAKHVGAVRDASRSAALRQAMEEGCLDPRADGTDIRSVVYADGKVVSAPVSGETIKRWRAQGKRIDAGLYKQKGEQGVESAIGTKFVLCGVRAARGRNARILLDVVQQPHQGSPEALNGYGGEAGIALRALLVLGSLTAERGGRVRTACYDGAFRGVHIEALMRAGMTVLSPVNSAISSASPIELVTDCPCGRRHELVAENGDLREKLLLDTGETFTRPLRRKRVHPRNSAQGYAWYAEFELPCGAKKLLRLDAHDDQARKNRNTAERVRQHPPGSPLYEQIYGRREEAESTNNNIDRTLYGGRMPAHTADKQNLVLLGFMLARNILARHALAKTRTLAA